MRSTSLGLGQSSLKLVGLVAAASLVAILAACAESPVDDDPSGVTQETKKAEPEGESQKLPPSNPPKTQSADAGTSSSSGGSTSSSGGSSSGSTSSSSGSTSSSGGSSSGSTSSSGGSSSGGTSTSCDPNDTTYLLKAFTELNSSTPRTCGTMGGTCKSTECCFDIYGVCVDL